MSSELETITIPLDKFKRVQAAVEDFADLAAHDRAMADIEAGRKSGSLETARRLAEALGVALDDLV